MGLNLLSSILDEHKSLFDESTYSKLNELTKDGIFCAAQIEEVVSDQLDLTKIESGLTTLNNSIVDLTDLIDQASKVIKASIAKKNVSIEIKHCMPTLLFKVDHRLLLKVIINLLTNAAKFTDKGQICIETRIHEENDTNTSLSIVVSDTGIGMSKESLSTLFQKFNQARENTNKNYGGSGLGLCITKSIIELMRGKIVCFR